MDEPSVLDYVIAKLQFWRKIDIAIPPEDFVPAAKPLPGQPEKPQSALVVERAAPAAFRLTLPWRSLAMLFLALIAQRSLEPPDRTWTTGVIGYFLAIAAMVWAVLSSELKEPELKAEERLSTSLTFRPVELAIGAILSLGAFALFKDNTFTVLNVWLWVLALVFVVRAFWLPMPQAQSWSDRLRKFAANPAWKLTITPTVIVVLVAIGVIVFFRVYQLDQVPPEMTSDHAEKLLDVSDVLNGKTSIFFPRNTGREAFQMYLTAVISLLFGTGLSFMSLKIGTVLAGLFTLPYIYLLGKEFGNRWVGFWAVFFTGIAYWPNVFSRLGLRFPLYPLFVAPALFYLLRGLRTSNRNDFILSGLALGIGLHGYTSIRILPFAVVLAFVLYLLHKQAKGMRKQAILGLFVLSFVALIVFLPLLRYAIDNPEIFAYRAFTRVFDWEQPLPGPVWKIFLENLWNAMTMFFWSDGEIWVHSVTFRPALDVVSGALLFLGMALLVVRYARNRHWSDLFMLLAVPVLMMPSILSLAFPGENPSLNRTSGAIVPVFIIVGVAMDSIIRALKSRVSSNLGKGFSWALVLFMVIWSCLQNYDLVFNQYEQGYKRSSWNTSEVGHVIRDFANSVGSPDAAWLVGYPYWMDSRLVGINAGYPTKDYAIFADRFQDTLSVPGTKLFVLNMQDTEGLAALRALYPNGVLRTYISKVETKDFQLFLVPGESAPVP